VSGFADSASIPTFAADIRPLFREVDRLDMDFAFDLSSYDDVVAHAGSILLRLEDGTMPCDAPWPEARVGTFRAWIAAGSPR
jgi:hypothetical protein